MSFIKNVFTYLLQWGGRALFVYGVSFLFVTPTVAFECGKEPRTVTVSLLIFSPAQRVVFEEVAESFSNQCPNILIEYLSTDDEGYKLKSENWLKNNPDVDIMLWFWPADLEKLIVSGLVEPVTDLWLEPLMKDHRTDIKEFITYEQQQYGIPVSLGFWGLYYDIELFTRLGIARVETWGDLLQACKVLVQNDIVPIALGTKEQWPVFSWFDYMNLRMNGLSFHKKVMKGEVPFTDERMVAVFQQWKVLIDNQCFMNNTQLYTYKQVLPLFFRQQAGVILSGNYILSQLPTNLRQRMRFTAFPTVYDHIYQSEISTVDYFIVSSQSKNKAIAKTFLRYISSEDVQAFVNERIDHLPVHPHARTGSSKLVQAGSRHIASAKELVQYFDRGVEKAYYEPYMAILVDFVSDGDVEKAITQLEAARKNVLFTHPLSQ